MGQLIAVVISILISMISLAGFAKLSAIGVDNVKAAAVASQMVIVDTAFHQYISDNSASIAAIATATTPVTLSIPTLVCAQYLPTSYAAGASCPAPAGIGGGITNAYRQSYYAQVLQPIPGQLQSIVFTSGGTAISRKQVVSIAALVGAQGGFVPYANQGGDSTMSASNANGVFGGWVQPLTNYTNPGSGHLAALLTFSQSVSNGYLYRNSVIGQPQLNTMMVPIVMDAPMTQGTACSSIGAIANDVNGGQLLCWNTINGQTWTQLVAAPAANVSSLPACGAGNANQLAVVQNPNSGAPVGTTSSVYECNGSMWNSIGVDANGNLSVPNIATVNQLDIQAQNAIDSSCAKQGLISVDPTGIVVTCGSHLTWEQSGQNVTAPNGACTTPGMQARDANNNTYMCN
jgi:hypothetical protein